MDAELAVEAAFLDAYPEWVPDAESSFTVELQFHCGDWLRRDLDNMAKLVMDALNSVVWADDAQVVGLQASVIRGSDTPKTLVTIRTSAIPWRRV